MEKEVTQAARDTWFKIAKCEADKYFGTRTKMEKELEVLADFESQTRLAATTALEAENAALRERVAVLEAAVSQAIIWFNEYGTLHENKAHADAGPEQSDRFNKAAANYQKAADLRAALKGQPT